MRRISGFVVLTSFLIAACSSRMLPAPRTTSPGATAVTLATGSSVPSPGTVLVTSEARPAPSPWPQPSVLPESAVPRPLATPEVASLAAPWLENNVYETALRAEAKQGLDLTGMTEYHLAVTLPANLTRVEGSARIRYTNRTHTTLDAVFLHLFPNLWHGNMTVSDVWVDGRPVTVTLQSAGSLTRVPLAAPLAAGNVTELSLHFAEPIPHGMDVGNYGEFALQDGMLAMAGFYPTLAVHDEQGWHLETPATQGDVLYADASLYDVTFTAPAYLTVAATGATAGKQDNGDGTATWRLVGGPLRDFNIVASAEYRSASKQVGDIIVNSYFLAADKTGGQKTLAWAAAALADYQAAFGPYPYRELDVVETSTTAGGIEYPGLVVVSEALYNDTDRSEFFEGATVHEVAHQWWYNVVGDDQVNNPWLDEALAQYSSYLYFQETYGEAGAQGFVQSLDQRWARVNREDKPIGLPVTAYDGAEYSAIVYGRGPLFFMALRDKIGAQAMSEFLRRYYHEYTWEIATPAGLKALAEQVSGQDLTQLFEEWVDPKK
jgi:hypothetical protein